MRKNFRLNGLYVSVALVIVGALIVVGALAGIRTHNSAHSGDPAATAAGANDGQNQRGSEDESGQEAPAKPVAKTYTAEELGEMEFIVAPMCYTLLEQENPDEPQPGKLKFTGGKAISSIGPSLTATIKEARPVQLAGNTLTAVILKCESPSGAYETLQFIDQDAVRFGEIETWGLHSFLDNIVIFNHHIDKYSIAGDAVTLTLPGVVVLGDDPSPEGEHSGVAHLTVKWDGRRFVRTDLYISTINGDVAPPNLDDVKAFYKAASEGRDDEIANITTATVLHDLRTTCIGACQDPKPNFREFIFPADGFVDGCYLAQPGEATYYNAAGESRTFAIHAAGFDGLGATPGEYVCGLQYAREIDYADSTQKMAYSVWLILRTDRDGSFIVQSVKKAYS